MISESAFVVFSPLVTVEQFDDEDHVPLNWRSTRVMTKDVADALPNTRARVETSSAPAARVMVLFFPYLDSIYPMWTNSYVLEKMMSRSFSTLTSILYTSNYFPFT